MCVCCVVKKLGAVILWVEFKSAKLDDSPGETGEKAIDQILLQHPTANLHPFTNRAANKYMTSIIDIN